MFLLVPSVVAVVLLAQPSPSPSPSPTPSPGRAAVPAITTPEEALVLLRKDEVPDELAASIKAILEAAAAKEPSKADWQIGLALLGMDGKLDRILARTAARKATELAPQSAEAWATRGSTVFMTINQAATLDQMSLADEGKDAYLKAIALDPKSTEARQGLAMFYINAPGIAGGSLRKAREQGRALLEIDGAAYKAHLVLALAESEDEEWSAAAAEFSKAREVASNPEEKLNAIAAHANMLLTKKEDPKATIAFLIPLMKDFGSESWQLRYFLGQAYKEMREWAKAQAEFQLVLAAKPDARNTAFVLAEVLRKQQLYPQAAAAYRSFASKFPDDARAAKALEEAADCDSR